MIFSDNIMVFFLVFTRISGIFTLVPIFNSKNIPVVAKAWFVFFLALIVLPLVNSNDIVMDSFLQFGYYIMIEFIIGLLLGAVVLLVLNALYLAGGLVDRNIGFSMVSVISATDESQLPVSANLYFTLSMLIFLTTNAHHMLIRQILRSFELIPLGHLVLSKFLLDSYVGIIAESFVLGVKIAMPFIITILISNIILGILSKAMPGMNVFMIGMPFKVLVGLVIFLVVVPTYYLVFVDMFDWSFHELIRIMEYISGK